MQEDLNHSKRERERERETDRQTDRQTDRDRQTETKGIPVFTELQSNIQHKRAIQKPWLKVTGRQTGRHK